MSKLNFFKVSSRVAILCAASFVLLKLSYIEIGGPIDFGIYLSSAKALLEGSNPWDAVQLSSIAHRYGYLPSHIDVLGLWTPPIILLLLSPFTLLPFSIAAWLWILLNVITVCIMISLIERLLLSAKSNFLNSAFFFTFPPLLSLLVWGQITCLVLFGYILFIYFSLCRRDFLAGMSLILALLKPHLGFLALIYIFWSAIGEKRWGILWGCALTLVATLCCVSLVNGNWFSYYKISWEAPPLEYNAATIFQILRRYYFPEIPWIQFSGAFISSTILFGLLIFKSLKSFPQQQIILVLLACSTICAPYGWVYDQIVIFPLLVIMLCGNTKRSAVYLGIVILPAYAAYYIQLLYGVWGSHNPWFAWFPFFMIILWSVSPKLFNLGTRDQNNISKLEWNVGIRK